MYYYHVDHLGTPIEVTDDEGNVAWHAQYRAWGQVKEELSATAQRAGFKNPLRFQGQYHDEESGLHYNRFRYYDPELGRYISEDPIRLRGGLNTYQYAPNPTGWVDPLGLNPTNNQTLCSSKNIENSAGNVVERRYVNNQDELLAEAEKAAGGSLDLYDNPKEYWYHSKDGNRRIEWNPDGHANTNEGPHVTVRDFDGRRHAVTEKIFIRGQDTYYRR